jgi:AcrR family transcriptional regulator
MTSTGSPSLPPLTPERRREQTRRYLLEAASRVFTERGFHGATLDEVAAAAGFTKGAVYSNFKSKDDLFLALLEYRTEQEMANLRAIIDASEVPPEARLSDFAALGRTDPTAAEDWTVLYAEFRLYALRNPPARERLAELDRAAARSIAEMIEEGRRRQGLVVAEPAEEMARIVLAMFHGVSQMRALDPDVADEEFFERAVAFATRALLAGDAPTGETAES